MWKTIAVAVAAVCITETGLRLAYKYFYPTDEKQFKTVSKSEELSPTDDKIAVNAKFTRVIDTDIEMTPVSRLKGHTTYTTSPVLHSSYGPKGYSYWYSYETTSKTDFSYEKDNEFKTKILKDTGYVNNLGTDFLNTLCDFSNKFDFDFMCSSFYHKGNTKITKVSDFIFGGIFTAKIDQIVYLHGKVVNKAFFYDKILYKPYLFNDTKDNIFWYNILDICVRCTVYPILVIMLYPIQ